MRDNSKQPVYTHFILLQNFCCNTILVNKLEKIHSICNYHKNHKLNAEPRARAVPCK